MKIIVGDKVLLQKFVMDFIEEEFYAAPGALYASFAQRYPLHFIHGAQDAIKFDYEFDDEPAVEFLKDCEYIFDFVEYSKKSIGELETELGKIVGSFEEKAERFDQADDDYKKAKQQSMQEKFDQTRLMCEQIKMMIACKKGEIKFPALPDGINANLEVETKGGFFSRFKRAPR